MCDHGQTNSVLQIADSTSDLQKKALRGNLDIRGHVLSKNDCTPSSTMAPVVNSPRECCIKTVEHSGTAGGTTEIIAGVPTYVSRPQSQGESRKIVLFFADVYGPFFLNSLLLMDYWASHGYLVLALDYFEGDTIDKHLHKLGPHYSLVEDYVPAKMTRAKEITPLWIDAIKEQFGTADTKWLVVGYCFGGPFVMDCLAEDWVTAGAFAHPACLEEAHFLRLKQPLLLSLAGTSHRFHVSSCPSDSAVL